MRKNSHNKRLLIAALLVFAMNVAFASLSFTGITDENTKNSKYSLKNVGSLSNKAFTISHIKTSLQYNRSSLVAQPAINGSGVSATMQYDLGNSTYVLPYKYKVRIPLPKFKTPTPDNNH
ncbi:MAG: hypothetical protein J0I09_01295 [Sphingobacteriia bacterium]|nr:hypothetical protein [Sphingobacteriia bacterium]